MTLALIMFAGTAVLAQNPPAAGSTAPRTAQDENDDLIIGLEDVLSVTVWKEPTLSTDVVVRPDGKITLPLVNDIVADGLTVSQLREQLTKKYSEFVADPTVTVIIKQLNSQKVSIVGEIVNPGSYALGSPMTVLELLARAGGFRQYANSKKVRIVRKEGGKVRQFVFNYKDVTNGKNLEQNITLKSGDVVIVP